MRTKGSLRREVTWDFLSSARVDQRIDRAGLFQAVLLEIANDHAGQG
ncbi:MAG TPA: hypothetical protein VFQ15_03730 [Jiangellaceae bacterium]|nr:hypothetical protein [Jiangellaceae bacterium]